MVNVDINAIMNGINGYCQARSSQIYLYRNTALYYQNKDGDFLLYKPGGEPLPERHTKEHRHPVLFIREEDRVDALKELQGTFTEHLKEVVSKEDPVEIKSTLVNMVQETLEEPRAGVLGALSETVSLVVEGFGENHDVMKTLAFLSDKDYTTAIHVVNVMAMTIGYCNFIGMTHDDCSRIGLMAMLHDIGKTEVPTEILQSTGKLSDDEFRQMQSHPQLGADIIIADPAMAPGIELGALEHHEKLDGSGYPNRITNISFEGRLIGIIDCYEALTGDDRPYRRAKPPLDTLELLKEDVNGGKLDKRIFMEFCRSLV